MSLKIIFLVILYLNSGKILLTQCKVTSGIYVVSHLLGHDRTVYWANLSIVFDLSQKGWHCSLSLSLSLLLSHPVSHQAHAHTLPLTFSASFSGPSCAEKVGVVLRSQPSVQICLGAQRDFLICATNTNAFLNSHRPGSLPASYLVMHYSHPLLHPLPPSSRIRRRTAAQDFPGTKSIRRWRLCFKWAINRTASQIYFVS